MDRKKIWIIMIEAGNGHKAPALSIQQALEKRYPEEYDIQVMDFFREMDSHKLDAAIKNTWDFALKHALLTSLAYTLLQLLRQAANKLSLLFASAAIQKTREYIEEEKPALIFSTHYYSTLAATQALKKTQHKVPIISMATDPFDGHVFWADKDADTIIIGSDIGCKKLIKNGIQPGKIQQMEFPINEKFFKAIKRSKSDFYKQNQLNTDYKTIVITDGGQGIGKSVQYALQAYKDGYPFNIIIVCGRNTALQEELLALKDKNHSKSVLLPMGYVNNMEELLYHADLMIGKAGVSTTFEALLMRTPIIYTAYIGGHEKTITDYVTANKCGYYLPRKKQCLNVLHNISKDATILEGLVRNIENLRLNEKMHAADEKIADFLVDHIHNPAKK